MKQIYGYAAGALAVTFTLAACVPAPGSTPTPEPVQTSPVQAPVQAPTPAPATPSAPVAAAPTNQNWLDLPQTAGTWRASDTQANFVTRDSDGPIAPSQPLFIMECRANMLVMAVRTELAAAQSMTVRTETADRTLAITNANRDNAAPRYHTARLQPRDPLLDAIALTRGRFAVEVPGQAPLYLPAWAEVSRVIELCR